MDYVLVFTKILKILHYYPALLYLFSRYHHDVTLTLMLKEMYIENKTMPYARLSPESAVMWRAMAEFLHKKEGMEEAFEHILPDLTVYCSYIRE